LSGKFSAENYWRKGRSYPRGFWSRETVFSERDDAKTRARGKSYLKGTGRGGGGVLGGVGVGGGGGGGGGGKREEGEVSEGAT